jgi:hypothetical protein
MTPLIFASAMALFRATLSSPDPLFPTDGTAGGPVPLNGVWAGLPADCETPTSLDLSTWPKCATPIGFLDGVIAVLEKPGPGKKATPDQYYSVARTKFWSVKGATADAPDIVQVDIPILFAASTIYIAVLPDAVDDHGSFIAAKGWPIGCPATAMAGVTVDGSQCSAASADGVRAAAAIQPSAAKTYRLVRVNATPSSEAAPATVRPTPTVPASSTTTSSTTTPETAAPPTPPTAAPPSTPPTAAPGEVMETPLDPPAASPTDRPKAPAV